MHCALEGGDKPVCCPKEKLSAVKEVLILLSRLINTSFTAVVAATHKALAAMQQKALRTTQSYLQEHRDEPATSTVGEAGQGSPAGHF